MEKIILINDDKAISVDNEAQAAAQPARLSKTRISVCIDSHWRGCGFSFQPSFPPKAPTSRLTSRAEVRLRMIRVSDTAAAVVSPGQETLPGRAGNKAQLLSIHLFIFFVIFVPVRRRPSLLTPSPAFLTSRRAGERCGLFNY